MKKTIVLILDNVTGVSFHNAFKTLRKANIESEILRGQGKFTQSYTIEYEKGGVFLNLNHTHFYCRNQSKYLKNACLFIKLEDSLKEQLVG